VRGDLLILVELLTITA